MQKLHYIPVLLVLVAGLSDSSAEVVYTWVDDSGITCFSDTPPANESARVELIDVLPPPAAGMPVEEDFYSVIRQAERMESRRLLNEKLTAERLQAEAEASRARAEALAAQQPDIIYDNAPDGYFLPYYPYPQHRRPHKGHKPGRPGRPEHNRPRSLLKIPPLSNALRPSPDIRETASRERHRVHRD